MEREEKRFIEGRYIELALAVLKLAVVDVQAGRGELLWAKYFLLNNGVDWLLKFGVAIDMDCWKAWVEEGCPAKEKGLPAWL